MDCKSTGRFNMLREVLDHLPCELRFGTSGRRGLVSDLTQLEVYINARAELEYLLALPECEGGILRGQEFYFACDLRPSSTAYCAEHQNRGEIAQAIVQAIVDAGLRPVNLGQIPTPALTCFALQNRSGAMMVTGSHIPFDRNGYKTNSARGELLKKDEAPIAGIVRNVREQVYGTSFKESPFAPDGSFKGGSRLLPPEQPKGREAYLRRYLDFFPGDALAGWRILVYQHSAVGRDMLVEILQGLGAEVVAAGRSDRFVPIDTENVDEALISAIREAADGAGGSVRPFDAVVSTDGDSDRPLVLGTRAVSDGLQFIGGDLLGMVVAEYLGADAVVVPVSCNDAIDRGPLRERLEPKTRIGSPYVVEGMERALARGCRLVCGWEANGGFLLGSDIERHGRRLHALPTRDAVLPIVCALIAAAESRLSLIELISRLPQRFSRAGLLRPFARERSLELMKVLAPGDERSVEVVFRAAVPEALDSAGRPLILDDPMQGHLESIRGILARVFAAEWGFGAVCRLNFVDGIRIYFAGGDVVHVRPSGNADELRIYSVADSQDRADQIVKVGCAEPDGLLRRLVVEVLGGARA